MLATVVLTNTEFVILLGLAVAGFYHAFVKVWGRRKNT